MTRLALLSLGLLFLAGACQSTPCSSPQGGMWQSTASEQLDLESQCEFFFYGPNGCSSSGTYTAPLGTQGTVDLSIIDSTGGVCLPVGDYECVYTATETNLHWDCGLGAQDYTR